jgi:hypothetical protein
MTSASWPRGGSQLENVVLSSRMRLARWIATAWVALIGLGSATVAVEYLPHTDDGCAVEIHCLACRTSLSQTATTTTALVLPAPAEWVEWRAVERPRSLQGGTVRVATSRGPPLS